MRSAAEIKISLKTVDGVSYSAFIYTDAYEPNKCWYKILKGRSTVYHPANGAVTWDKEGILAHISEVLEYYVQNHRNL